MSRTVASGADCRSPAITTAWCRAGHEGHDAGGVSREFLCCRIRSGAGSWRAFAHRSNSAGCVLHIRRRCSASWRFIATRWKSGVSSDDNIGKSQLVYLKAALARVKSEGFKGALLIAHHHLAYTAGSIHGWSEQMLSQIDDICSETGVWPHAVLSGHAHNYQRFTRLHTLRHRSLILSAVMAGTALRGSPARVQARSERRRRYR